VTKFSNGAFHAIFSPRTGQPTVFVNRQLRSNGITQTRLLACDNHRKPIFLVVTGRKIDPNGTSDNFKSFLKSERACQIRKLLEIGDVEFITIPNPYSDDWRKVWDIFLHHRIVRSFQLCQAMPLVTPSDRAILYCRAAWVYQKERVGVRYPTHVTPTRQYTLQHHCLSLLLLVHQTVSVSLNSSSSNLIKY
jgi:hypothetical protein